MDVRGDRAEEQLDLIRVHRMTHLGKRRVEYKKPVRVDDEETVKKLEISCTFYKKIES